MKPATIAAALILGTTPMHSQTPTELQVTRGPGGRILTNTSVWSPDGQWIAYDTRSDAAGEKFDGSRIEMVNVLTGEVRVLYESRNGAYCGVVTFHPRQSRIVFILGPENPTPDWQYNAYHRQGVIVDTTKPGVAENLDARDLVLPFTPGALRGGSHVHVWDPAGEKVSFTYEDHVLAQTGLNQRNIGVSVPGRPVVVPKTHPRNHDGSHHTVLVTRTTANPKPGSDEIKKAFEEGWVGQRALAFQGHVVTGKGETISEVFIADLPDDLTQPGSESRITQRRLTFTANRKYPGIQGPRHWLRSSPDGSRIAFLMKDDAGIVQLWTISPNGGALTQLTRNSSPIASAFMWSTDGKHIAHVMDNSVCVTDTATGATTRLTPRSDDASAPRPEACVFSPNGTKIAFVRRVPSPEIPANQIFVVNLK
jgi:Tol biopolymer transport system component